MYLGIKLLICLCILARHWFMVRSNITHSREDRAREEIFRNGPLTAAFLVPQDFVYYKKGKIAIFQLKFNNLNLNKTQ